MYNKERELRGLIALLRSVQPMSSRGWLGSQRRSRDYPILLKEANLLDHLEEVSSTTENRKLIVEHLEQLPSLLNGLKDRARREDKKEVYGSLIARLEESRLIPKTKGTDFSILLAVWKHWDKSKEKVYALAEGVLYGGRLAGDGKFKWQERMQTLSFQEFSSEAKVSLAIRRFVAKVVEILPKPKITSEDYEFLLQELEAVLAGWREVDIDHKNRDRVDHLLLDAEAWITELYVLSLLDS